MEFPESLCETCKRDIYELCKVWCHFVRHGKLEEEQIGGQMVKSSFILNM